MAVEPPSPPTAPPPPPTALPERMAPMVSASLIMLGLLFLGVLLVLVRCQLALRKKRRAASVQVPREQLAKAEPPSPLSPPKIVGLPPATLIRDDVERSSPSSNGDEEVASIVTAIAMEAGALHVEVAHPAAEAQEDEAALSALEWPPEAASTHPLQAHRSHASGTNAAPPATLSTCAGAAKPMPLKPQPPADGAQTPLPPGAATLALPPLQQPTPTPSNLSSSPSSAISSPAATAPRGDGGEGGATATTHACMPEASWRQKKKRRPQRDGSASQPASSRTLEDDRTPARLIGQRTQRRREWASDAAAQGANPLEC